MSEMKHYLASKLEEFNRKHNARAKLDRYDGDLKRQWKRDEQRMSNIWREVDSIADVQNYIDRFVWLAEQEDKVKTTDLCTYTADVALYCAVYAIQKAISCFDMERFDFSLLDKEAIDAMFGLLYSAVKKKENAVLRRTMWD